MGWFKDLFIDNESLCARDGHKPLSRVRTAYCNPPQDHGVATRLTEEVTVCRRCNAPVSTVTVNSRVLTSLKMSEAKWNEMALNGKVYI